MKTLILSILLLLLVACGSKGGGNTQVVTNTITLQFNFMGYIYDPSGISVYEDGIRSWTVDPTSFYSEVVMDKNLFAESIEFVDKDNCLASKGVVATMHENFGTHFSFYFVRNDMTVTYDELVGCELQLKIQTRWTR